MFIHFKKLRRRFFQREERIIRISACSVAVGTFFSREKPRKGTWGSFTSIVSNRENGDRSLRLRVSAGGTTALWFRGWPWPWCIDQPVKPGSRHDYEGSCSTISPSLAKIPGEIPRACRVLIRDSWQLRVDRGFSYLYCYLSVSWYTWQVFISRVNSFINKTDQKKIYIFF